MPLSWTDIQKRRLSELNSTEAQKNMVFSTETERDAAFKKQEALLIHAGKKRLNELRNEKMRPSLCNLETRLVEILTKNGFVQVTTPVILAKNLLAKMTIDDEHALYSQVFWLDEKMFTADACSQFILHSQRFAAIVGKTGTHF